MEPDLVLPDDLTGFPGAPFTATVVAAVADAIRAECGWHVAPQVTSTVRVDVSNGVAVLPTLRLVGVTSVTAEDGQTLDVRWGDPNGVVRLKGCYTGSATVMFEHGYERCPPALIGSVAAAAQLARRGQVRQESLGSRSVSYGTAAEVAAVSDPVVARFKLGPRP